MQIRKAELQGQCALNISAGHQAKTDCGVAEAQLSRLLRKDDGVHILGLEFSRLK
jgi:hypothetical protein